MASSIEAAVARAQAALRGAADPAKAAGRKAYIKTELDVLGCGVPDVRRAAKAVRKEAKAANADALIAALAGLRASPVHDDRLLAILIAEQFRDVFDDGHVRGLFHDWLGELTNWDTVDALATFVIGHVALAHPKAWATITAWTDDSYMWRRRASLLCHIPAVRNGKFRAEQFRAACDKLVDEPEFFIRKAMGWTIRECVRFDPPTAEALVREFGPRMSGLTYREATRNMPKSLQATLKKDLGR